MNNKTEIANELKYPDLSGARILLIDDDQAMNDIIGAIVKKAKSIFAYARNLKEAKEITQHNVFDIALIDMILPDANGIEIINYFHTYQQDTSLIVITGHADYAMVYSLEHAGITSVLTKPFSSMQLQFTLCKELARRKLHRQKSESENPNSDAQGIGLVGTSSYIKNLNERICIFAHSNIPILIEGPTGTGKEIIANAIHRLSPRSNYPMMIVNSSAIPEHLEESEFFGHAKGSFTGAFEEKAGIIECSNNTSLFLDEVGELSLRMQAKLLRVLDGQGYTRIGDAKLRTSDFRLLSATNRPLLQMIDEGTFRQDFYFRLKSGIIETMPLCNHKEDIPLLVRHFMLEAGRNRKCTFQIRNDALDALIDHNWPGNIRELKNIVDSLCTVNSKTGIITFESIEMVTSKSLKILTSRPHTFSTAKTEFERQYYINLLSRHNGNITTSAHEAQIDRPNFSKKLKLLGIHATDYKIRK